MLRHLTSRKRERWISKMTFLSFKPSRATRNLSILKIMILRKTSKSASLIIPKAQQRVQKRQNKK